MERWTFARGEMSCSNSGNGYCRKLKWSRFHLEASKGARELEITVVLHGAGIIAF